MNTSSEKEQKKVNADKAQHNNEVREGQNYTINDIGNNKDDYPHKNQKDKQLKSQEEYIDRNGETKDKS